MTPRVNNQTHTECGTLYKNFLVSSKCWCQKKRVRERDGGGEILLGKKY